MVAKDFDVSCLKYNDKTCSKYTEGPCLMIIPLRIFWLYHGAEVIWIQINSASISEFQSFPGQGYVVSYYGMLVSGSEPSWPVSYFTQVNNQCAAVHCVPRVLGHWVLCFHIPLCPQNACQCLLLLVKRGRELLLRRNSR